MDSCSHEYKRGRAKPSSWRMRWRWGMLRTWHPDFSWMWYVTKIQDLRLAGVVFLHTQAAVISMSWNRVSLDYTRKSGRCAFIPGTALSDYSIVTLWPFLEQSVIKAQKARPTNELACESSVHFCGQVAIYTEHAIPVSGSDVSNMNRWHYCYLWSKALGKPFFVPEQFADIWTFEFWR